MTARKPKPTRKPQKRKRVRKAPKVPAVVTLVPAETVPTEQEREHLKRIAFIEAYADEGTISAAAKTAGMSRTTHYNWLKSDPDYAALFTDAREDVADSLESEAHRRARKGWLEPVFYQGKPCGAVKKFSDTLLIFLLKGLRPEKFRERFEHSGPSGAPLTFTLHLERHDRDD